MFHDIARASTIEENGNCRGSKRVEAIARGRALEKRLAWAVRVQALAALRATRLEQTPGRGTAHRAHDGDEHKVVVKRIQLSASALRKTQNTAGEAEPGRRRARRVSCHLGTSLRGTGVRGIVFHTYN